MNRVDAYIALIKDFVGGGLPAPEFQRVYLSTFKAELAWFDEPTFELLDSLFGDADAYTEDRELLESEPSYFVSGAHLKMRANQVLRELERLRDDH